MDDGPTTFASSPGLPKHEAARTDFAGLAPPRVRRELILQRLLVEQGPHVVILQAPAGHGKTATLAQIQAACTQRGTDTAWLTLEAADNDGRRHASRLRLLAARLGHPDCRKRASHATSRNPPLAQRTEWFLDALSVRGRDVALFIDEFEVLTDRAVLSFWRDFLLRCPEQVRVFIGSRTLPELGLARLLIGGKLLLLGADDLRFSQEEVKEYFRLHDELELHPAELAAIYRRSEGWPAAVQLFRLGLSNLGARRALCNLDRFRPRELTEYLTECVLESQTAEIRDFLLRTSVLSRLCAPLCDAVTRRTDSQRLLLRLEREGLFIRALDQEQRWFQYHPLFAALLREQLTAVESAAVAGLHGRAAEWLRAEGWWDDAMRNALAAQDVRLAHAILKDGSSQLIPRGEMATVVRWFEQLPTQALGGDLAFAVRMIWGLLFGGRSKTLFRQMQLLEELRAQRPVPMEPDESTIVRAGAAMCADRIQEAETLVFALRPADPVVDGFEAFEEAAGENLRAYLMLFHGDLATAHVHLSRARSFNDLGESSFSGGYTACFEGAIRLMEGHVKATLECLRSGLDEQRRVLDSTFMSSAIAAGFLWALYEADERELFDAVAEEYRDALNDIVVPDFFAVGQMCLARNHAAHNREDDAVRVIDHAQFVAARNGWPRIVQILGLERLALSLRIDAHRSLPSGDSRSFLVAVARHRRAWLSPAGELAASSLHLVEEYLEGAADPESSNERWHGTRCCYSQLHGLMARALWARRAGKGSAALRHLQQAVSIGARTGLARSILDYGPAVPPLLEQLLQSETFPAGSQAHLAILHLLGRTGPETRMSPRVAGAAARNPLRPQDFTDREREVLRLLAKRFSNREIAQRICVTENTVKFHLKNIFLKLGVKRRLEVVSALGEMNCVPD